MASKIDKYTKEQLAQIVADSHSYRDVATKVGYAPNGGSGIAIVKNTIKTLGLDISHFTGQGWNKDNFDYSRFQYGKAIKAANMLNAIVYLRGHKCECCGLETWNNQPIALEVHHKDGDHLNNVLENLELLCPNCHAQTDNYRGRNIKKSQPISDEMFVAALQQSTTVRQALITLGLTPAGANYDRAYKLISEYNITNLIKNPTVDQQAESMDFTQS